MPLEKAIHRTLEKTMHPRKNHAPLKGALSALHKNIASSLRRVFILAAKR